MPKFILTYKLECSTQKVRIHMMIDMVSFLNFLTIIVKIYKRRYYVYGYL